MKRLSKRDRKVIVYGNEKQTIPVLMPDTRYRAFKSLSLRLGKPLNQLVRDLIEQEYEEELNDIEQSIFLASDEHESSQGSYKAERITA